MQEEPFLQRRFATVRGWRLVQTGHRKQLSSAMKRSIDKGRDAWKANGAALPCLACQPINPYLDNEQWRCDASC